MVNLASPRDRLNRGTAQTPATGSNSQPLMSRGSDNTGGFDSRLGSPKAVVISPRNASMGNFNMPMTPRIEGDTSGGLLIDRDVAQTLGMRYSLSKLPAVSELVNKKEDFGIQGY